MSNDHSNITAGDAAAAVERALRGITKVDTQHERDEMQRGGVTLTKREVCQAIADFTLITGEFAPGEKVLVELHRDGTATIRKQ